jgi:hypothetical protein
MRLTGWHWGSGGGAGRRGSGTQSGSQDGIGVQGGVQGGKGPEPNEAHRMALGFTGPEAPMHSQHGKTHLKHACSQTSFLPHYTSAMKNTNKQRGGKTSKISPQPHEWGSLPMTRKDPQNTRGQHRGSC